MTTGTTELSFYLLREFAKVGVRGIYVLILRNTDWNYGISSIHCTKQLIGGKCMYACMHVLFLIISLRKAHDQNKAGVSSTFQVSWLHCARSVIES